METVDRRIRATIPGAKARFENILRISFNTFVSQIGQGYGVSRRINYSKLGSDTGFSKVPRDLIPAPTRFNRLPFEHMTPAAGDITRCSSSRRSS